MIKVKAQLPSPSNRRLFRLRRPAELAIHNREPTDEQTCHGGDDCSWRIAWLTVRSGRANRTTGDRTTGAGGTSGADGATGANGTSGAAAAQAQPARFGARL